MLKIIRFKRNGIKQQEKKITENGCEVNMK